MREPRVTLGAQKARPCFLRGFRQFVALVLAAGVLAMVLAAPQPVEAQAPSEIHIISGPTAGRISGSTVTVTWVTDKAKPGQVTWGAHKGHYKKTLKETAAATNHSLTITGLSQTTTFHYKVKTGTAKSADGTFTTANYK